MLQSVVCRHSDDVTQPKDMLVGKQIFLCSGRSNAFSKSMLKDGVNVISGWVG